MNQPKQPTDLDQGREWLDRAAQALNSDAASGILPEVFARAAAEIGCGYVQLAAVEQQAEASAGAAQHNERILEMQSVVADAHRALEDRVRAEQAEIEARTAKLAELDAATLAAAGLRQARAEAEGRPHDCEFVVGGLRCVLGANHTPGHHTLQDGSYVDEDGDRLEPCVECEADRG